LKAFNGVLQVNYSSGRYFSGSAKETAARLPFDAGFEVIDVLTCRMLMPYYDSICFHLLAQKFDGTEI
jgi:hypothetical protein